MTIAELRHELNVQLTERERRLAALEEEVNAARDAFSEKNSAYQALQKEVDRLELAWRQLGEVETPFPHASAH